MQKVILIGLLLTAGGCGRKESTDSTQTAPATVAAPNPASPPAEDGMCAAHGVLEAVCTKCNPKLIPVFKAKNDWCAEHDFPESFCPVCHPELHGRPAMDVAVDEAPADGLRIKFATKEVAQQIGLETSQAVSSDEARVVTATATIVARPVCAPWPISTCLATTVTVSSAPMRTNAFGAKAGGAAGAPAVLPGPDICAPPPGR